MRSPAQSVQNTAAEGKTKNKLLNKQPVMNSIQNGKFMGGKVNRIWNQSSLL